MIIRKRVDQDHDREIHREINHPHGNSGTLDQQLGRLHDAELDLLHMDDRWVVWSVCSTVAMGPGSIPDA